MSTPPPFIMLRLGARALLGFPSSWQAAVRRLEAYSLAEVLDLLGRISVVLDRLGPTNSVEASLIVLRGIFGQNSIAERSFLRAVARRSGAVSAFDELQLVTAAKIALLVLPSSSDPSEKDWKDLGRALLIINDLVDPAGGALEGPPTNADERRQWMRYLIANGFFHHAENDLPAMGRAWALYLERHVDLLDHHRYVDLPELFERATGVQPVVLASLFFALHANWQQVKLEDIPHWTSAIDPHEWLATNYEWDGQELETVLPFLSAPADAVASKVRDLYSLNDINPYHMLPLAKAPLLQIEGRLYCPSVQLLRRRYTRGLHHFFLSAEDGADRQRFLDFMGPVFESWVSAILDRTYSSDPESVYLTEQDLASAIEGPACDAVVVKDGIALLFEAKAPLFTLAATAGRSWDEFEDKARRVFVGGAEQMSHTLEAIREGSFATEGVVADDITAFVPIVVTLEQIPLQPMVYDEIDGWIREEGLLQQDRCAPWQTIEIGDLEGWEVLAAERRAVHREALTKAGSGMSFMSFGNYWIQESSTWSGHNAAAEAAFTTMTDAVQEFFKKRSKTDVGPDAQAEDSS